MTTEITERLLEGLRARNSQLWTIIQKKKILIGTDFGAIFLIQKNYTIG